MTSGAITYAAANNSPVLVSGTSVLNLAVDKMPVGKGEKNAPFTLHTVTAQPGDVLYLYTDGYADQFGGPKGKKFKYRQLESLLQTISKDGAEVQKKKLEDAFVEWRTGYEQVDDVLVIGIKL
jgi:serine phosphatase RsbU (regulator of sigma subunit)